VVVTPLLHTLLGDITLRGGHTIRLRHAITPLLMALAADAIRDDGGDMTSDGVISAILLRAKRGYWRATSAQGHGHTPLNVTGPKAAAIRCWQGVNGR